MAFNKETFDLFSFLNALGERDLEAYNKLSDDGKKAASPLVVLRWLSGTGDQAQIIRLNEFANKYIFSLGTDKALLFKLLAVACTSKSTRVTWLKGPSSTSTKLAIEALKARFECSTREANSYLESLDSVDILQYAEALGWDKDKVKKLTLELGKDDDPKSRSTTKRSSKSKN